MKQRPFLPWHTYSKKSKKNKNKLIESLQLKGFIIIVTFFFFYHSGVQRGGGHSNGGHSWYWNIYSNRIVCFMFHLCLHIQNISLIIFLSNRPYTWAFGTYRLGVDTEHHHTSLTRHCFTAFLTCIYYLLLFQGYVIITIMQSYLTHCRNFITCL